jgi:hypothetical protein
MFLLGGIGTLILDKFKVDLGMNIAAFYWMSIICIIIIPYGIIKNGQMKKYIIFGEREKITVIFKKFELKSYFIFIPYILYISVFPVIGIPMIFRIFNIDFLLNIVLRNFSQIVYSIISLLSFLWFAYHIVILNHDINQAKEKLALLTAIITTISTIISNIIAGDLKIILAYILLSYAWIRYLIEVKANNKEIK